jgi:DNA-binding XRE family transcriptional regulator
VRKEVKSLWARANASPIPKEWWILFEERMLSLRASAGVHTESFLECNPGIAVDADHVLQVTIAPNPEESRIELLPKAWVEGDIAQLVRQLCAERGLTQKELAHLIGCSRTVISKIFNGKRVKSRVLFKLERLLELPSGTLVALSLRQRSVPIPTDAMESTT